VDAHVCVQVTRGVVFDVEGTWQRDLSPLPSRGNASVRFRLAAAAAVGLVTLLDCAACLAALACGRLLAFACAPPFTQVLLVHGQDPFCIGALCRESTDAGHKGGASQPGASFRVTTL
jgi:hypothetical protein